jgi:hypothetical protein
MKRKEMYVETRHRNPLFRGTEFETETIQRPVKELLLRATGKVAFCSTLGEWTDVKKDYDKEDPFVVLWMAGAAQTKGQIHPLARKALDKLSPRWEEEAFEDFVDDSGESVLFVVAKIFTKDLSEESKKILREVYLQKK